MRYLIQNKKEFAISIGVFVMTLINLIRAIMTKQITEECIVAFVLAFFRFFTEITVAAIR